MVFCANKEETENNFSKVDLQQYLYVNLLCYAEVSCFNKNFLSGNNVKGVAICWTFEFVCYIF